ncbi:MAG: amidohydrolase family protein [Planctomycetota bacterium]
MQLDTHQHFWAFDEKEYGWIVDEGLDALRRDFLPADLRPLLDAAGVEATIAVQARQTLEETEWLLELAAAHPWIAGVVGWMDLEAGGVEEEIGRLRERPGGARLVGMRHVIQGEAEGFMDRPAFREGVRELGRAGLTYDLLIFERQMEEAVRFCAALDGQPIVLDHVGKPRIRDGADYAGVEVWRRGMRELGAMPHVSCKLSGMVTEADVERWTEADLAPFIETSVEAFGVERLMFGSDWPVCTLAADYARVRSVVEPFLGDASRADRGWLAASRAYGVTRASGWPAPPA